jgi:hypothetical protein
MFALLGIINGGNATVDDSCMFDAGFIHDMKLA